MWRQVGDNSVDVSPPLRNAIISACAVGSHYQWNGAIPTFSNDFIISD